MEKATLARNFINKIWNATKFFASLPSESCSLRPADKWILTKLNAIIKSTTKKYEKFDFGVAGHSLQRFFWNDVCDWYIEESKQTRNPAVFKHVLATFLKLINPIMPFVTEQIYCKELGLAKTLLFEPFPVEDKKLNFPKEAKEFEKYIASVMAKRSAADEAKNRDKQIEQLKKEITRSEAMLANENFVSRAPKELVAAEREKLENNRKHLANLS